MVGPSENGKWTGRVSCFSFLPYLSLHLREKAPKEKALAKERCVSESTPQLTLAEYGKVA